MFNRIPLKKKIKKEKYKMSINKNRDVQFLTIIMCCIITTLTIYNVIVNVKIWIRVDLVINTVRIRNDYKKKRVLLKKIIKMW